MHEAGNMIIEGARVKLLPISGNGGIMSGGSSLIEGFLQKKVIIIGCIPWLRQEKLHSL